MHRVSDLQKLNSKAQAFIELQVNLKDHLKAESFYAEK